MTNCKYPELKFDLDSLILLTEKRILSEPNTFQMYLEQIGNHKIRKTILLFVDHFDLNQEYELNDALNNLVTGNYGWVMTSVRVPFVLIFAVVQLSAAEYVVYGCLTTIEDSLSLNPNRCHHQLITQLSHNVVST